MHQREPEMKRKRSSTRIFSLEAETLLVSVPTMNPIASVQYSTSQLLASRYLFRGMTQLHCHRIHLTCVSGFAIDYPGFHTEIHQNQMIVIHSEYQFKHDVLFILCFMGGNIKFSVAEIICLKVGNCYTSYECQFGTSNFADITR